MTFEDLDKALVSPGSVFPSPEHVAEAAGLSAAQKIEILLRWSYDAAEEAVATEEGMPGGNGDLERRILVVLGALNAGIDVEHPGPSKQHGLVLPRPVR